MRKIFLIFFLILFFNSTVNAQWRLDGLDNSTVRNFRLTSSNTSASAQLSAKSFSLLKNFLERETLSGTPIYIVDLRQESHGFANGVPVSWYEEHNHANLGKLTAEILDDEMSRLKSILGKMTEFIPLGREDESYLNKTTLIVENVCNEKYLAESNGFKYIRFAAADMIFPEAYVVDEFLKFYLNLPKNYFLHFHCHAGHGRTTTFLVMHDILKNPDLSLDEIVQRQKNLGGSDLLKISEGDDWYAKAHNQRANMLKKFYQYVKSQRENNFKMSWGDWIQN